MTPGRVQQILLAYGDVLSRPVATGMVRDVKSLPFPKAEIKTAVLAAIGATADPNTRELLKAAFVSLADFQELTGEEVGALEKWVALTEQAVNISMEDLQKTAASIAEIGQVATGVQGKAVAEAESLFAELQTAGV